MFLQSKLNSIRWDEPFTLCPCCPRCSMIWFHSSKFATSVFSSAVSVAASQLRGLQFKPELRLLSEWHFICSPCSCMGFLCCCFFHPLSFRWLACPKLCLGVDSGFIVTLTSIKLLEMKEWLNAYPDSDTHGFPHTSPLSPSYWFPFPKYG